MTAPDSLPLHALTEDNLAAASPDLLRAMVKTFADALMSAEADAMCNAEYGQVSDIRLQLQLEQARARLIDAQQTKQRRTEAAQKAELEANRPGTGPRAMPLQPRQHRINRLARQRHAHGGARRLLIHRP